MKATKADVRKRPAAAATAPPPSKTSRLRARRASADVKPLPGAAYWRRIVPGLHVADAEFQASAAPIELPPEVLERCRRQLIVDGFFALPPDTLPWASSLPAMRVGVRRLLRRGWPASMLLVYDEAWAMAAQLASLMAAVSGGCENSLDMLAWSITPSLGEAGFAPHRDRQPADVKGSFRKDGTPKYATCWVALSEASVDSSCLYIVPRGVDKGYDAGDDMDARAEDPLIATLRSDAAVQAVRACPLKPGGCVIFSHRAMHWGSSGRADCDQARISISFGHSDPTFERPYFARPDKVLPYPSVGVRLALVSAQLIAYHERFAFGLEKLRRFGTTFRGKKKAFTKEYAEKVAAEFKAALDDQQRNAAAAGAAEDDSEGEAALDDALDAMLDAQAQADGNLFDDFDDYAAESDDS